jgi:hypothetical protein
VAQDIGRALEISSEELKFSSGWLQNFKKRFGLRSVKMHGEAASAPLTSLDEERVTLRRLLSDYRQEDIFNADETGLFYRMPPGRTLATSSNVPGHKKDKTRITVLLGCNSTGSEKLKPLVIGTARNPRSLNKVNRALLPVEYHANKKAWMRSDIFIPWLNSLNSKFTSDNRHALLLIDNAPSHFDRGEVPQFSNLKIHCLPPNCTAHLQPLDAGIINDFKVIYKRLYNLHILERYELEQPADASTLHKIDVRRAIDFIADAWSEVSQSTIANCWSHTGILDNSEPDLVTASSPRTVEDLLHDNNMQAILDQVTTLFPNTTTMMTALEYFEVENTFAQTSLSCPLSRILSSMYKALNQKIFILLPPMMRKISSMNR